MITKEFISRNIYITALQLSTLEAVYFPLNVIREVYQ